MRGRVEESGGRELSGFVYLEGVRVRDLSAPRCALQPAPAREWPGEQARGGRDAPWEEG